ncbi:MAG: hypothetical protein BWY74_03744 [Firmicutes bacterium ADurb.Bin419]|nr:MAG: hypothetical protein BWY74_03744 [Firmicutes bacterium ADurb.Bin419]
MFIEKVTALYSGVEIYKTGYENSDEWKGYDLYIFDGILPDKIPDDGNIMVFNPPKNKLFEVLGEVETPLVEDLGEDIFKYVEGFDFSIGKTKILKVPSWGREILRLKDGTAAFAGVNGNIRVMVFGFDIHNTDIPLTPVFPIIMANSMDWLLPQSVNNAENVNADEGIEFNIGPKTEEAFIKTPSGEEVQIAPPFPIRVFEKTDEPGLYTLRQKSEDGEQIFYFTVNVPSQRESNLMKGAEVQNQNEDSEGENALKPVKTGMNLQTIFLWLILIVLLIEWWVYTNAV